MSISITIDGNQYSAQQGDMIIEVADRHKITIPRFCYHEKLSIAANCRMCLVEVERAPKPLPACATPVSEGMIVHTQSEKTQLSQKAVMEFLLINHPLDCPICDQGGECELQDLSMKYGYSQSRFKEDKRVAQNFNLGPLVSTDMTRCIHCTRCIRFGSEIAGIKEMGATSRGESTQVGTYLETHLSSELSANIIDICPVGALTSKPHRSIGRTWEYKASQGVSFNDTFGTNLQWHHNQNKLRRILPRNNESLNENWIADRDRYSLLGMYSENRLGHALIRQSGALKKSDNTQALESVVKALLTKAHSSSSLCGLLHPNSTFEEAYLFQKLMTSLGSSSVDYRIQEHDITDQDQISVSPTLPMSLDEIIESPLLIIGNNLNQDVPLLTHRLRQSARSGQAIYQLGWSNDKMNIESLETLSLNPNQLTGFLGGVLKHLLDKSDSALSLASHLHEAARSFSMNPEQSLFIEKLCLQPNVNILLAPSLSTSPYGSDIRFLAQNIARLLGGQSGSLFQGNSIGCTMAGAHPHHGSISEVSHSYLCGLDYQSMLQENLDVLVLFNIYPEDTLDPDYFLQLVEKASKVIGFYAFESDFIDKYVDIVLPLAVLSETEGHHINCFGQAQNSKAPHLPYLEAKPGWKLLKVLADKCNLAGFEYHQLDDVFKEGYQNSDEDCFEDLLVPTELYSNENSGGIYHIHCIHPLRQNELLRQSLALQKTSYANYADYCHISPITASSHHLAAGDLVELKKGNESFQAKVQIDKNLAPDVVQTFSNHGPFHRALGNVEIRKVS